MLVTLPRQFVRLFSFFSLVVFLGPGCSKESPLPPRVPVSGTVLYQGAPVSGATVVFEGETAARPGVGVTDQAGKFRLSSYSEGDGVPPGKYRVAITKFEAPPPAQEDTSMEAAAARKPEPASAPKSLLPKRYADSATSGLEETVAEGNTNDFTFDLTD
jgi:hypothetical protein